jgi:hypothetical protein
MELELYLWLMYQCYALFHIYAQLHMSLFEKNKGIVLGSVRKQQM